MSQKESLLQEFSQWNEFMLSIEKHDWNTQLGEGKWTIHDVVSHILLWDKYFLESAIQPIFTNQSLTLKQLDYDKFNQDAMEYGKSLSKDELIDISTDCRNRIIKVIDNLNEENYSKEYVDADGNQFTVQQYLKDFIWHDQHHRKQIEDIVR